MFKNEEFMNNNPNVTLRKLHRSTMNNIWPSFLLKMNQWALTGAVSVFALVMVLFINNEIKHMDECSEKNDCNMILMGYYYFPWNSTEHYWLANMEDVMFGAVGGTYHITKDMFFASYICYMISRLRLLSYVLRHLKEFVNENHKNFDVEINNLLSECVNEHQIIIR